MKKVDFNKLQAGDLVEVPRTQFAPMRSGWNGWLFSEAVVIRKGVGRKSKRNVVVVEMRTPAGKNSYGTIEATFYAENVFTTPAAKNARNILKKYGIEDAESFYKFIERDDVTGCTAGQKVICKECRIKQRIKKCSLQKKWGAAGMDGGACLGFSHDGDDEPIERCKRCIACTSFDWDEEKERLKL
jgi:hypothetical protein